jgi:hypothetical protein
MPNQKTFFLPCFPLLKGKRKLSKKKISSSAIPIFNGGIEMG